MTRKKGHEHHLTLSLSLEVSDKQKRSLASIGTPLGHRGALSLRWGPPFLNFFARRPFLFVNPNRASFPGPRGLVTKVPPAHVTPLPVDTIIIKLRTTE